ncbi:Lhr family ATP-dependent helicase, partial [Streptomyces sp. 8N706]|uniref:Lhr family ATP-dependent helicase n=1 Tax=Streptomyces sp. 8N706 TaxID=3457416 RepID=UPI003FCF3C12
GALHRLAAAGRVVQGEFHPAGIGQEWCDSGVLRRLRRRSLAALRQELEPVPPPVLASFLPQWQHIGTHSLRGIDGLVRAIEQLQGAPVPASALEKLVLPSRVTGYSPTMLDELTAAGEVVWAGAGALPGKDGWVSLFLADAAPLLLPPPHPLETGPVHQAVLEALSGGYGLFFRQIADQVRAVHPECTDPELADAVWDLAWSGRLTNDTLSPLRSLLGSGRTAGATAHRAKRSVPRGRYGTLTGRTLRPPASRTGPPTVAGRWALLPERETDTTHRAHALARTLLDRHGVVTRGAVSAEGVEGGFSAAYRVLSAFEETGQARRGYVVEGLGAAQFAMDGAVDRLRAVGTARDRDAAESPAAPVFPGDRRAPDTARRGRAVVLAAADPANAYGAALPWPEPPTGAGHKPGRKAGALVVLVDGDLALYVERGGKTLLAWPGAGTDSPDSDARLHLAAEALAAAARDGALGTVTVERANGSPALSSPIGRALESVGFHATPRGLRLRGA